MQVPKWFVIGCSLVLLNFVLVLSTIVVRHATAGPPTGTGETVADQQPTLPGNEPATSAKSDTVGPKGTQPSEGSPLTAMPEVPSIDSLPPTGTPVPSSSSILSLEDFKRVFSNDPLPAEVQTPSQQLTQGFFEALELRLESVGNLNEAAKGLVREAAILYQRGEITESRNLLGKATQLRELAAQLLVTRQ